MRAFAITGMVTASMIPTIISGSDMRATPPAFRMSAGTRSSAITATAPASSAILAWSGVTTSMMTPPLSIWARPVLVAQVDVSTVMWDRFLWSLRSVRPPCLAAGSSPVRAGRARRASGLSHGAMRGPEEGSCASPSRPAVTPQLNRLSSTGELSTDGPDDPRHELRGAAGGRRRQARQRLDQLEHVIVLEPGQEVDQPQD